MRGPIPKGMDSIFIVSAQNTSSWDVFGINHSTMLWDNDQRWSVKETNLFTYGTRHLPPIGLRDWYLKDGNHSVKLKLTQVELVNFIFLFNM